MARLALVSRYIGAAALGDLSQRQDGAECQFLADFMAAAPKSRSTPVCASASPTPFTPQA